MKAIIKNKLLVIMLVLLVPILIFIGCDSSNNDTDDHIYYLLVTAEDKETVIPEDFVFTQASVNQLREYVAAKVPQAVVFNAENSYRYRPTIYLIAINITNETITYSAVPYRYFRLQASEIIGLDQDGFLFPLDFENELIDEVISLQIADESGSVIESAGITRIRLIRNP